MAQSENKPNDGNWSGIRPHDEFLELCAVSTTGELSTDEQQRLKEHLATCPECQQALSQFQAVAGVGAPLLSAELATPKLSDRTVAPAQIEELVSASTLRNGSSVAESSPAGRRKSFIFAQRNGNHSSHVNWNYVWLPFAAAVLLTVALGIYSYQLGRRHAAQTVQASDSRAAHKVDALEKQLSDAGHEREVLQAQLAGRDRLIRDLQRHLEKESAALSVAESAEANLDRAVQNDRTEKQQIAQEQNDLRQKLGVAEVAVATTKAELDSAQHERQQEQLSGESLEEQIKDLNAQLRLNEQELGKQDDLLAYDRDIRDLMGARDLYIAEVYDVARDGTTRKPYGRIFYTKGKSLIFYAYDLDEQPGVKNASIFQAWGQNGPDRQQAISLGIFYQDSAAKKRWVLKSDDPQKLDQINAVFVTVEPPGGSHKPDGKSLLFASLRIEPNHP